MSGDIFKRMSWEEFMDRNRSEVPYFKHVNRDLQRQETSTYCLDCLETALALLGDMAFGEEHQDERTQQEVFNSSTLPPSPLISAILVATNASALTR